MVLVVKNPTANAGEAREAGLTPGSGRSLGEANSKSTSIFLPGKSRAQRSLAGYSPWGRKEWDITEQVTLTLIVKRMCVVHLIEIISSRKNRPWVTFGHIV